MRIAWKPIGWVLLTVLVLAILLGVLAIRTAWDDKLQNNGIETFEWQGLSLSLDGMTVSELKVSQTLPAREVVLQARDLALAWRWPEWGHGWMPGLTVVTAKKLQLDWHTKKTEASAAALQAPPKGFWPPKLPAWLPSEINIQQFEMTLPCEAGRCLLVGNLSITSRRPDSVAGLAENPRLPVTANLQLDRDGHHVDVLASLDGVWPDDLSVSAELAIDGTRYLSLETGYRGQNTNGTVSWDGSVNMPDLPQTDWLLAWLQDWQSFPAEQWPEHPETGSIQASWQLQGPENEHFLEQVTGSVKARAQVPQPWPAPGLGKISGTLEVALDARQGQWQPETLSADMELTHPAAWIKNLPELMRPSALSLSVRPAEAPVSQDNRAGAEQAFLPLNLELNSRGGASLSVSSHLAVTTSAPWRAQLGKTRLEAALPELEAAGWRLEKPRAQVELSGWLDATTANLTFHRPTNLKVDRLEPLVEKNSHSKNETLVQELNVDLANTMLNVNYHAKQGVLEELSLGGPLHLAAKQVKHLQLQPQSWQFNGTLNGNLLRTHVAGLLKAKAGTSANIGLNIPYQGPLRLSGEMRVSGKQEAEALSRVFVGWPELLTVAGGTVSANATYNQPGGGAGRLAGKLVFADWSGTYDRTAWRKMNGTAEFFLDEGRIEASTPGLTLIEVNPGIPIGPVRLAGQYKAPLAQLGAGLVTLEQAYAGVLGGEVTIQPASWDLAQAPVTVPVRLRQLSLARLLQLYPTDGLAGTGILSGTVPLLFDPATGVRVKKGRVDALKPGGRLQLTAERLKALANQSETMSLVAQALEDFRYSALDSSIDYDENGTLMLALHLKGSSPRVGDGRPVVLNINLEENIPALLTSLQLSGKVSDAVSERVKNLLQKREREPSDLLE